LGRSTAFEDWPHEYQQRNTYEGESGTVVPKALWPAFG
jgi:hypothetical protein